MVTAFHLTACLAEESAPAASGGSHDWLIIILIVAGIAVVVFLMAMLARYLRIAINLFLDTPLPVTANLHDYETPTGEIVRFPSLEGRSLRGMFIDRPAGLPYRGTVLFCHEFGSDMMSAGRYAWPLVQAGYSVFTFDFRGHGGSFTPPHFEARHWTSNHDVNDILAAIAYVQERGEGNQRTLGILGISRGAGAALIAAAINPTVRCVAVDGVFSNDLAIDELMKRWVEIFVRIDIARADRTFTAYRFFRAILMFYVELKGRCRFPSSKRALAKLKSVPVLFIHGQRDTYIRPEQAEAMFRLKPGEKDLWICPDAKHNQAVATDPKTYAAKLVEFFGRRLAGETPSDPAARPEAR